MNVSQIWTKKSWKIKTNVVKKMNLHVLAKEKKCKKNDKKKRKKNKNMKSKDLDEESQDDDDDWI